MRILVLGGTRFLGRHLVGQALERGHNVTTFTRGNTNPELFPEATRLRGDRDGNFSALEGGEWDAVVDTSGYVPRVVRTSAELLHGRVSRYVFVSSISVYGDLSRPVSEDSVLAELEDPTTEDVQEHYGGLKAACERVVEDVFGERALVVRPGLIVGPHDPTGRFTYWPHRIARGGDVLAPGRPGREIQVIDVRDLAGWILRAAEQGATGRFNATGPVPPLTMEGVLKSCREVTGSDARFVWVSDDFLHEHEVGEWMELPLWLVDPAFGGMLEADVSRAVAAGLAFRPLADTIAATIEQAETVDGVGLSPEREQELLAAWNAR
jgi:2'-hydroxyisoflavone reductase